MRLPTTAAIPPGPPLPPVIVTAWAIILGRILWGRRRLLPLLLLGLLCLVGFGRTCTAGAAAASALGACATGGRQTQAGKQSNTGRQAVRLASKHIRKHSQMHMAMLIRTSTIMPQCLGTHTNSRQRPGSRLAANCHATQATLFPNHRHGAPQAQAQGQQHSSVLRTQTSTFSILHGARQGQAGKQAD